jgi:hypothetical protein
MSKKVVFEGISTFIKWDGDYLTDDKTEDVLYICLPNEIRRVGDEKSKKLRITIEEIPSHNKKDGDDEYIMRFCAENI